MQGKYVLRIKPIQKVVKDFALNSKKIPLSEYCTNKYDVTNRYSRLSVMKCSLCQRDTNKLVDSHIIAQSIHALSTRAEDPTRAKILSNTLDQYPKKSPTGIYDKFLGGCCEVIFQQWEDYALKLFTDAYELPLPIQSKQIELIDYNYHQLKLFCISILWKADASTQDMYQRVNVGKKHRETLRKMLLDETPGDWQSYSILMERFNSAKSYVSITRSPQKAKMNEMIFYTFYMAGFRVHIKCDNRRVPEDMAAFFLKDNQPLRISLIPFEGSREQKEYTKIVYYPNNLKAFG